MAIEDYYNQTAQRFSRGRSTPSTPSPTKTNIDGEFSCWINNRGGSLVLEGGQQNINYNSTLKCPVSQNILETDYIRHIETGREFRVVRVNNNAGGYRGNHQTVYLEVSK